MIQADRLSQATEMLTIPAQENEGLHTILVCPNTHLSDAQIQNKLRQQFKHYDFFAMIKQPTSLVPGTIQWVIEWSDADATRSCASYLYNLGWINVSLAHGFACALGTADTSTGRGFVFFPLGAVLSRQSSYRYAQQAPRLS